jgi:hypothetical protein
VLRDLKTEVDDLGRDVGSVAEEMALKRRGKPSRR